MIESGRREKKVTKQTEKFHRSQLGTIIPTTLHSSIVYNNKPVDHWFNVEYDLVFREIQDAPSSHLLCEDVVLSCPLCVVSLQMSQPQERLCLKPIIWLELVHQYNRRSAQK